MTIGRFALEFAIVFQLPKIVELLLDKGVDPNLTFDGSNAISTAINYDSEEIIELLLENKAEVNQVDSINYTPLIHACVKGSGSLVKLLLKYNADINFINIKGVSPLLAAVGDNHPSIVQILLDHGANPNSLNGKMAITALHLAAHRKNLNIIKLLVEYKADLFIETKVKTKFLEKNTSPFNILGMEWLESQLEAKCFNSYNDVGKIELLKAYMICRHLNPKLAFFEDEIRLKPIIWIEPIKNLVNKESEEIKNYDINNHHKIEESNYIIKYSHTLINLAYRLFSEANIEVSNNLKSTCSKFTSVTYQKVKEKKNEFTKEWYKHLRLCKSSDNLGNLNAMNHDLLKLLGEHIFKNLAHTEPSSLDAKIIPRSIMININSIEDSLEKLDNLLLGEV